MATLVEARHDILLIIVTAISSKDQENAKKAISKLGEIIK